MSTLSPSVYPGYAAECGDPRRTKTLGFGTRPALLLVDICEAYACNTSPLRLESVSGSLENVASLLTAARQAPTSVPIVYAQTCYISPSLRDAGLMAQKAPSAAAAFLKTDDRGLWKVPTGLEPDTNEDLMLFKKYPSPFFGTNLATQLTALGIDTLLIAGFTTGGAVRATVIDAMQHGFRAMVVGEACADRSSDIHYANMFDMNAKYGDCVSVEEAQKRLGKGWVA
ncbi:hypothetical protein LTR85_000066 [Meristemomyces frigidus]|nr:hypothetical protein LTR85_000066 [Meristemomyces frigidus]